MTTPRRLQINVGGKPFVTLDVWLLFNNRGTCGIYVGAMTTRRKLEHCIEGKVLLPSMCGRFPTIDALLERTIM